MLLLWMCQPEAVVLFIWEQCSWICILQHEYDNWEDLRMNTVIILIALVAFVLYLSLGKGGGGG